MAMKNGGHLLSNMMLIVILLAVMISVSGCAMAFEGTDTAAENENVAEYFVQIGDTNLYYDKDTKIVYWISGSYAFNTIGDDYTTSYITAYYAPNGKPYRYDTEKRKLVEIP